MISFVFLNFFPSPISLKKTNNHHLMETMLTDDYVSLLLHGVVNLCPLLQVFSLNQVNSLISKTVCFHISISNNRRKHKTLIPTIYNSIVEDGKLKEGTIIKVTQCTCNIIHNTMYDSLSHLLFFIEWILHPYFF